MAKNSPKKPLLKAVPINPKTGKQARVFTGRDVIYGYKAPDGTLTPLDMEPQRYTKTEQRQLQSLINRNKIQSPPETIFFQKRTNRNDFYKGGEIRKEKILDEKTGRYKVKKIRAKKGEPRYIYENYKKGDRAKVLKVTFKPPTHRIVKGERAKPIYRKIAMRKNKQGDYKQHIDEWRLQERSKYERLQDQIMSDVTKLKKIDLEGAKGGVQIDNLVMKGKTLSHTLSTVKPPQSFEQLKKQKVSAIGMNVIVKFKDGNRWKHKSIGIPAIDLSEYSDIRNILSKNIRAELLNNGKTFTKLSTFKTIKENIKKDFKAKGDPYFPEWKKTGVVMSGGKVHDMTTAMNKAESPYDELKKGQLKLDVSFRYYK